MSVFTAFATFVWSFVLFSYPWLCWLHWLYSPLLLIKAFKWNGEPSWVADTALWWTKGTGACWLGAVNSVFHWCSLTVSLIHLGWGLAEAEVWQSTALSLWSGPLSRKFLQMWSTNGHAVSPDWEGWLTGHRVLNLLLNNFLINLSRLLSELTYPKHGELRQPRPAGYFQNWYVKICTWAFWFLKPYISCVCVCVYTGQAAKHLISPDVVFLGFNPSAFQKKRRARRRMQFLLTRISTRAVVMLVPSNKPLQNVEKCLRSDESQQRRRGYGRNYARHIKADGLKLSLMIGGLSRLCYGRRIQKRFTQHTLKQMLAVWVTMGVPLSFLFQSRK